MKDGKRELIDDLKDDFKESYSAFSDMHNVMVDDQRFIAGENHWPEPIKADREGDDRPCLVINKLPAYADQLQGDLRQNRLCIKVRAVDSDSDPKTANVLQGMIKNIEVVSNAQSSYITAVDQTAVCGKGAFRIITEYSGDNTFEQDILIQRVKNSLTVYPDPMANEWSYSDGRYMFVTEQISRQEFKDNWPNADPCNWQDEGHDDPVWWSEDSIRVAECFRKATKRSKLYIVRDQAGALHTVRDLSEFEDGTYEIVKKRDVISHDIKWYKMSGKEILEEQEWPGKYFPVVLVWGKELNVEGRTIYRGIVRHAKDSQRLYNYYRSQGAEAVALSPKAPYVATAKQINGYEQLWKQANKKNYSVLLYNPDPEAPGAPQRQYGKPVETGIQNEIMIADQELHDTTGLQQSSLGQRSNEKSGVAISERKKQGDRGQFAYIDNLARALTYAGVVIVDLIPHIWDTERIARLGLDDGTTDFVPVNQEFIDGDGEPVTHDLKIGKYDVVVDVGPAYQTQREEATTTMLEFINRYPVSAPVIGDLLAKNLDFSEAETIAARLKTLVPPEALAASETPKADEEPPEEPQPNPLEQLELAKLQAELEGIQLENAKTQAEIAKVQAETEKAMVDARATALEAGETR